MRTVAVIACLGAGLVAASSAWAAPHVPCRPRSRVAIAAEARLTVLRKTVEATRDGAPPEPLAHALGALLETTCFEFARYDEPDFADASTRVLKAWWSAGGEQWLADQLGGDRTQTFPPALRHDLSLVARDAPAAARLFCADGDEACAALTAGWVERAEASLRAQAEARLPWGGIGYTTRVYDRPEPVPMRPRSADDRRDDTLDGPLWRCAHPDKGSLRYDTWHDCVRELRMPVDQLPVGAMRPPSDGWLVVKGRRGHYNFCDGETAFDLATGAYYALRSCSGLALESDGHVNGARTDAARKQELESGRLSLDNLRELAWMLLVSKAVDKGVAWEESFPVPPGLSVQLEDNRIGSIHLGSFGFNSGQTELTWAWFSGGQRVAEGDFTWPSADSATMTHIDQLLRVAEAGRQSACAPVPLDPGKLGCVPGAAPLEHEPQALCASAGPLGALRDARCVTKRP